MKLILSDCMIQAIRKLHKTQNRIIAAEHEMKCPLGKEGDILLVYNIEGNYTNIQLLLTSVYKTKLRAITDIDAIAEGIEKTENLYKDYIDSARYGYTYGCLRPILSFRTFWILQNGENSWENNPSVWVLKFIINP